LNRQLGPSSPALLPSGEGRTSLQSLRSFQNLFGSRAHPIILRQHPPTNCAGRIDKKLRRPRDISAVLALAFVNQIVASNRVEFCIGKKRERVSSFLTERARFFRRVYANRNGTNARGGKLGQLILDAPQLGVA
jgi:hypothetical protein